MANLNDTGELTTRPLAVDARRAAEMLSISRGQIYCFVNERRLPRLKIGRRSLFLVSDLEALLDDLKSESHRVSA